jgi:hypothetical protein
VTRFDKDPYVWFDPFELFDDFQYALEVEERLHREAMGRMAEAHHIAGQRFNAQMQQLQNTLARAATLSAGLAPPPSWPGADTKA